MDSIEERIIVRLFASILKSFCTMTLKVTVLMVDYVGTHVKTNAGMLYSTYLHLKTKTSKFYKIIHYILNIHSEFHLSSKCQTFVLEADILYCGKCKSVDLDLGPIMPTVELGDILIYSVLCSVPTS